MTGTDGFPRTYRAMGRGTHVRLGAPVRLMGRPDRETPVVNAGSMTSPFSLIFLGPTRVPEKEHLGYVSEFRRRNIPLYNTHEDLPPDIGLDRLIELAGFIPSLILHPDLSPILPSDLTSSDIPSACFQIDTWRYSEERLRWSLLFDHVFVFHPGFEEIYRNAGHSSVHTTSHAVDPSRFESVPQVERGLDLGAVARAELPFYETRKRILTLLSERFEMNDWKRLYSFEEMVAIYKRSKIVVNVGTDYWPQDANLRVFEAMASGALLVTSLPSELEAYGFVNGVHFVGYRSDDELLDLVRYFLGAEDERLQIATRGQELTFRNHTYSARASYVLNTTANEREARAPARDWRVQEIEKIYLEYWVAYRQWGASLKSFTRLSRHPLTAVKTAGQLLAKRARRMSTPGRFI